MSDGIFRILRLLRDTNWRHSFWYFIFVKRLMKFEVTVTWLKCESDHQPVPSARVNAWSHTSKYTYASLACTERSFLSLRQCLYGLPFAVPHANERIPCEYINRHIEIRPCSQCGLLCSQGHRRSRDKAMAIGCNYVQHGPDCEWW